MGMIMAFQGLEQGRIGVHVGTSKVNEDLAPRACINMHAGAQTLNVMAGGTHASHSLHRFLFPRPGTDSLPINWTCLPA